MEPFYKRAAVRNRGYDEDSNDALITGDGDE